MSGGGKRGALSCSLQLQTAMQTALQRARPALGDMTSTASQQQLKLPAFLGVRRSAQSNADYQTGLALMLGNRLREPPARLAQDLIDHLPTATTRDTVASAFSSSAPLVRDAFVSNNGFVNMVLDDAWIAQQVVRMATLGVEPTPYDKESGSKMILADFAAPNLGKKLHVGHLRSSVIGDTICNLLEYRGHKVSRVSHTGDVGSALATLLVELMQQHVPLETLTDAQLGQHYESGKKRMAKDPKFKAQVDDVVIQLQRIGAEKSSSGVHNGKRVDPEVLRTWERACQVSREAYAKIFDRLKVNVTERGESTYLHLVPETLEKLKACGLAVESRGALCIFVDGPDKPPMLIQKQDGGFLYATVDLACIHSRIHGLPGVDENRYDEILYITDQSQELHFKHLFTAARLAGWTRRDGGEEEVKLTHAAFGLVLGKDGTKLSSRNGAFDYLEDLLNEAANECSRRSLADASDSELNRVIGDAAVRYFELSQQRERNYKFLFDNVLNLKGNTGVYLMYASARLHGILRKATAHLQLNDAKWADFLTSDAVHLLAQASQDWHPSERELALLLCQFDDEVAATIAHLYPHYLCDYLFRVVSHFHSFYEKCRVLNDPQQETRLLLCAATDAILRRGLQLVGVEAVKRM
uniref:arginine--tRNA ligase n=1 Tax=Globisporangium ultimum (strain ATCC 200006 / CBS 805.95 / DAOM BR144) TaxID=431595 RepID=K3WR21_GLOUD